MKQEHSQLWIEVKNYVLILIGSAIVAVGFNTLLLPNQIALWRCEWNQYHYAVIRF